MRLLKETIISNISHSRVDLGTKTFINIYCVVFPFLVDFAESVGGLLQTFRDTVSVPSSGIQMSKKSECPKHTVTKVYNLACVVRLHGRKCCIRHS